jgi:LacI family transcriptional regulator
MKLDMDAPVVLVLLDSGPGWSSGILRGFTAVAHERGWTVLHFHPYYPTLDLNCLARKYAPAAAVIGPELLGQSMAPLAPAVVVAVAGDRSSEGIASACLDEDAIAAHALEHLLAKGLRHVTTFRLAGWRFAIERERAFIERARAAGATVPPGWAGNEVVPARIDEDPKAMMEWLRGLPKPCGIFTCADAWARVVARYIRLARLRVPEDVPLVGADNDVVECELMAPPLSSVMIPWQEVGRNAALLVQRSLAGHSIAGKRVISSPIAVLARRSSDILAIDDALVAKAVRWIREHADRRLDVPMIARAVGGGRQRLERRFRRVLARTVVEEIRRARVDAARELLETTRAGLPEVAKRSGFSNAALLSVAFRREIGIPPGAYRRRVLETLSDRRGD